MPIFELDEGRPRLVQPMQPLAGSFAQECAALLTHHLAAVAGEPLFAVRARAGAPDHADLPELLALDATGRPVVVEVVQVVDDDTVVTALRHAGAAARMTTTDLTRAYHADPTRFAVDYAAFREQVSFAVQHQRREGVRVILLCSEVAAEASDTLGFLRGPDRQVDVLQVGVVRGVDDRRLIDVSPLATHEGVRRPVEPTALRLVRSSEAFATAMAYDTDRAGGSSNLRKAPTGELRAVTPPPAPPGPPAPTPIARRTTLTEPTPLPFGVREDDGREPEDLAPEPQPAAPHRPWSVAPSTSPTPTVPAAATTEPAPQPTAPERTASVQAPPAPSANRPTSTTTRPAPATLTPIAGLRVAQTQTVRPRSGPSDIPDVTGPRPFAPVASAAADPLPELATLAKSRRAVTTLVWLRERRGQRFVATLRTDGLLQLSDGRIFADPDEAATAAADSESVLDGWRAWRIGDGGPTLAEAVGRR